MKMILALLTGLMFLTACEMQQDPLTGASDQVREGRPPEAKKPVQEKPLSKDAMFIDAPILVNGRVGSTIEFKVGGRVMVEGLSYQLAIDNLHEFPGATFDETTGEFKWTPTKAILAGLPSIELPMRITLATTPTEKYPLISVERKTIILMIANSYSRPIVNSVDGSGTLVVGRSYDFGFKFEDIDAFSEADTSIDVRDCSSSYRNSIANFVKVNQIKATATPGKFEGKITVDLRNADTVPAGYYCFALQAISKHGVSSEFYTRDVSLEARALNTIMSMEATQNVVVGQTLQVAFTIFDRSGNGALKMISMDDIAAVLPGSNLTCNRSYTSRYQLDCAGTIVTSELKDVTADVVYTIKMVVENTVGNQRSTTNHSLRINVKAAP